MNEVTLPPSPNWYLSNILACSRRGTFAWGTKNNIIIAKQKKDDQPLEFSLIKNAHEARVVELSFCPNIEPDRPELIVSCGDDDMVKIWNLDTLRLAMGFPFNDGKPVTGIDWSVKDHTLVCAVNSESSLLSCNTQYNTSKKIFLGKLAPVCLACCPHESNYVAVGSKSGLIYIINLDNGGLILYKLRGHNDTIVSLSWCPSDINILQENGERDLLLVSGAKDRFIYIWKAGGDGRYETVLSIPKLPLDSQSHKSKLSNTIGNWIVVNWVEPKVLLTSSAWGELLFWDLNTHTNGTFTPKLFHTYHNRGLFCIATIPKYDATYNNRMPGFTVWTSAQDRWLVCCKQNDDVGELVRKIPTQGGFVYCIGACPIDTSCIAFGVGDAMLRLWKLAESHVTTFDITMIWQKIKGKIRAIAWYPENERLLAFGTSEGRVGVIDVIKHNVRLFRQYHRNTVYKLEWGPVSGNTELGLFSCAEGELVVYDMTDFEKKPLSIITEGCTEFSWKPDKLLLAIAMETGSIMFFDQKFEKCGNTIYILKTIVNCLVWHPESTAADKWESSMKDYLAVASDSTSIMIIDVSDLTKKQKSMIDPIEDEDGNQQHNSHKIITKLNGHSDKVVCLAWSPHFSGHLVSGSYDKIVQVWNVETKELMATYSGHTGPVLSCMWSPLKPQLIITGSSDFMLSIWDYTSPDQSPKQICDNKIAMIAKKNIHSKNGKAQKHKSQKTEIMNALDMNGSSNTNDSMNSVKSDISTTEVTCAIESKPQVLPVKNSKDGPKKREKKSYFPIYTKMIKETPYILDCIKSDIKKSQKQNSELQNEEKEQQQSSSSKEDDDITKLSFFSEQDLLAIIDNEKEAHIAKSKYFNVAEMDLWRNDLKQHLEWAVKEKRLTEFLVSLSTSLSVKTWKEMCEAYAHQLLMDDHVEKAVPYLLCINKIYDAIKAFLDAKMYKEAYTLAKLRLAVDDPVLAIVLQSWALHATNSGLIEQAAHCYMQLGEFLKAAKILTRRNDSHCLEVASEIAFMANDEEYGISLNKEAMICALMKLEYSKAHSIIAKIQQNQYLKVHIDTHEAIMTIYKKETLCDLMRKWLEGKSDYGVLQILKEKHGASYYSDLCAYVTNTTLENQATMQLYASYQIAMAATCDVRETQLKHIVTALSNIQYKTGECEGTKFFIHILATLDARKPTDEDSIYAKSDYPVSTSLHAYLCSGLLNWLLIDLEKLSVEEEIQFTKLIETLLDNDFQQIAKDNIHQIEKIKQLESQITELMNKLQVDEVGDKDTNEEWTNLTVELTNLKLDKNNFMEKRVGMPDPNLIYNQAKKLSEMLRDETNQSRFLEILDSKYNTKLDSKTNDKE